MGRRPRDSRRTTPRPRAGAAGAKPSPKDAPAKPRAGDTRAIDRAALLMIIAYMLVLAWLVLGRHPVPLYQVETDLLGEYVPAARDLLHGVIDPARYSSKGVGYPLLLAGTTAVTGGDFFLAARLLNLVAAAAAAWLGYTVFRAWFGARLALATLAAMLVNAAFVQAAVEAGTDLPAMALALASVACLVASARRSRASDAAGSPPSATDTGSPTWVAAAAGLLAGFTVITRSNYIFLPVAGAIVLAFKPGRPTSRLFGLLLYVAACALPIVGWRLVRGDAAGLGDQNALNVAYEFYGSSLRETFWASGARQFHTVMDVVRFDPPRFFQHLLKNLATRWMRDASWLLPVWIGVPAIAGMLLGAWRRPGGGAIFAHYALAYVTLATVFYLDRFSLFLVPFYASAAAWLVFEWAPWRAAAWMPWRRDPSTPGRDRRLVTALRGLVWVALLVPCAIVAGRTEWDLLEAAPTETRVAADALKSFGADSAGVIACKPHVAYFARRQFIPLMGVTSYADLYQLARRSGAKFLFYASRETERCPQMLALLDPGTRLPGLERIAGHMGRDLHYFALYRFTGESFTPEDLQRAAIQAAHHFAELNPGDPMALTTLADQLVQAHQPRTALEVLAIVDRVEPDFPPAERFRAMAYFELGLVDSARIASSRALRSASASSWDWQLYGKILQRQSRFAEARSAFGRALQLDPAREDIRRDLAHADSLARLAPPSGGVRP